MELRLDVCLGVLIGKVLQDEVNIVEGLGCKGVLFIRSDGMYVGMEMST